MTELQLRREVSRVNRLTSDKARLAKSLSGLKDYELNIVLNAFGLLATK